MIPANTEENLRWVRDDESLQAACQGWLNIAALAIDTEFLRRRTFYPIPALLQFYDGETVVIVDPLTINQWQPLAEVLSAPSVLKIFHAASEDLEVFWRLVGLVPAPLFDTQIAAGICGERPSMGYNKLVLALCDVDLPKDETNSDWLARPLTESQAHYAAADVYYLYQVYQQLRHTAEDQSRLDWVLEDCTRLGSALATLVDPQDYYRKLKSANRLSAADLAVARALAAWREQRARDLDLPRSWVMKDSSLIAMARQRPNNLESLSTVKEMPATTVRKQGKVLLGIIADAAELSENEWPEPLPDPRRDESKEQLARVQLAVNTCADSLSLAPEMLMNRKQMGETCRRIEQGLVPMSPPAIGGWRSELLEAYLEAIPCP